MVKIIKKSLKYFIIITGIILLLPTVLYFLLQNPEVQTFIVNRITIHFSREIKSTVSVGKIEFRFFNKVSIDDLLIKDQNNDTLIYSEKLTTGIRFIDIKRNIFRLGKVNLIKPVVGLITDSAGLMNLTWYLNHLRDTSSTEKKKSISITIEQIDINDARFSLINHSGTRGKSTIDFNNLHISSLNGIIEGFQIKNDTTAFNVYNLGFNESSGFSVNRMNSSVTLSNQYMLFNSSDINCNQSIINISRFELTADSAESFKNFIQDVRLNLMLERSHISTSDLRYFLPIDKTIDESAWLSGKVSGTVSELRGRNIELSYRQNTYLNCDFDLSGLPKIENAYIYIDVNSLKTNAKDIEKIIIPGKGPLEVPDIIYKLGNISFDGSFTGFTTDFVTYGEIRTAQGNIRTDISLRPDKSKKYMVKGLLAGNDIDLGVLTGRTELLGKLSMHANVDGYAYSLKKFAGNLTGRVDSVEINRYKYRNISLNGYFTEKTWDGSINIVDENIKLDLLGLLNFKEKLPEFDFTVNIAGANLYKLNFDKPDTTSMVTMLITSNFKGSNIDNLDGEIKLLNSNFRKYGKNLELYDFSIRTFTENNKPVLSLRSDFLDADIRGYYNFAAIRGLVRSTLARLMPSQFRYSEKRNELKKNNFSFEINFKNTDKINNFLRTNILLADKSYLKGVISPDSIIKIVGKTSSLTIGNNVLNNLSLDANISGSESSVKLTSTSLSLLRQSELKGLAIGLNTKPDNFVFTAGWDNEDNNMNHGKFIARGSMSKNNTGKGNAILNIDIDSTDIFAMNSRWKISRSSIQIDSNAIKINKLYISNNDHYYLIDGAVSENPADTLNLEFKGIDVSPLDYLVNRRDRNDTNIVRTDFKGSLNGKILLNDVYKNLLLESDLKINNFSMLASEFGTISIESNLDLTKKVVNIKASNNMDGIKMFDITGYYDPASKKVNLTAVVSKLPIVALNPLLRVFASGITGLASGKVNLSGGGGNIYLRGAVLAENATIKINYLQTKYKMTDSVRFDKQGIKFSNVKVTDEKGNNATVNGYVNHNNFQDFGADLTVNTKDFMVLNTKPKDNPIYYGTAFGTGVSTIKSASNSLSFDISARTGKNTKFYIPLNSGLSVSEYPFVSFVDSKSVKPGNEGGTKEVAPGLPKPTGIDMNFDLEATPDAEVQLIYDSKVGDIMKGRGSGNLNIVLTRKGDFQISGDYIIETGDYLFTLRNILNKSFSIENGGKIIFNGDLNNAEIDVKANYKLKASLYDILHDERYNERIPVECQLNLTGKLFNPIVGFNIILPTADEERRTYLRNVIATEEELSRQFLYLLVMNRFYTDPTFASSSTSTTTTGTSAMAVTTTEMLSNQLSNWLSQISNDFDIGFVYRPGSANSINPQEVQVALSTQILNDKVIINSNFDVRGTSSVTTNNANQITGDFDADLKLTDKIHFKVFNRYNNPYTGKLEPYTQGIGIFFKQDFNRFSDLFKKKIRPDMKKEDEVKVKKP